MNAILQDLKYSIRMLAKSPGFALVAILTLALGIGANSAIFSVVNGLLLHPAGVDRPERVVALRARYEQLRLNSIEISAPDFDLLRQNKQIIASAALEMSSDFNYSAGDWPQRLRGAKVSSQWFQVFGATPLLGRTFTPEEDQPNADHEVILAYNTWNTTFGADRGIIGRSLQFNQQPYKVVGVMRPGFEWPPQADLWSPLALPPDAFAIDNIFNEAYLAFARLQPGVTPAQAAAYINVVTQRVVNDPRSEFPKSSGWGLFSVPFSTFVYGDVRAPLLILLGAVGFVLLIACANVAGLLLARASSRKREFAVRTALGASSWRMARQMFTESFVLAGAGMLVGLGVAFGALRLLVRLAEGNLASSIDVRIDSRVLIFTVGATILSAVVFGAVPALQISRTDPQRNLTEGRGAGAASRAHHRFRDALVVGQLALALVLLAGAGIFLKSIAKMQDVNVGFRPHGLLTAATSLPEHPYDSPAKQIEFVRAAVARLQTTPGVSAAGAGVPLPFSGFNGSGSFEIEGRAALPGDPGPHSNIREISPGYLETLGVPVVRGRTFSDSDRAGAETVAVIDQDLANLYWPNQDPIGKHLRNGSHDPWATIVGVVGSVRHSQVVGEESNAGESTGSGKGVRYYPMYQTEAGAMFLVVRTASGNPVALTQALREAVHSVDPNQPISDVKTMDERIALSMGPRRSAVALLSVFASVALALAAIGLFGLVRYNVTQRIQEIGIRMALGAQPRDVLTMLLTQSGRLVAAGVAVGIVAALVLTRLMSGMLYQVSSADPVTFALTALVLALVAFAACYIPARRAMRVDPIVALRYE